MKKEYEVPEIDVICNDDNDVLTASYVPGPNEGEPDIF